MYTAYYLLRDDDNYDLAAIFAGRDKIGNEVSDNIKLGIYRALGGMQRKIGEPLIIEQDDPCFPQVWSEDSTMEPDANAGVIEKGFEEDSFLWKMWLDAIKTTGSPREALFYIQEQLTGGQCNELFFFCGWLSRVNKTVDHGNYYFHYLEYKKESDDDVRLGDVMPEDSHRHNPDYCAKCGGKCLYDHDGNFVGE